MKSDTEATTVDLSPVFDSEEHSPLQYFKRYFDTNIIEMIVDQTNLYSVQQTTLSVNTNVNEIEQLCGVLLYMGTVSMPSYTDFWAQTTNCEKITSIFSLKRFQKLHRYLHFANNENASNSEDRLYKIRSVLDAVVKNCRSQKQEPQCPIDEMMVPYKGKRAGNLRQYIQTKPHKWGFKIFVRAGISGITYDFLPYTGKGMLTDLSEEEREFGIGGQVVIKLCKTIPNTLNARVYFDNFFCTLELISYLKQQNIHSLGTLRKNRVKGCPVQDDKSLQKCGHGSYDFRMDRAMGLILVKWVDNKVVCLASSFCGIEPVSTVKRWNRVEKKKVVVPCPSIVKQYSKHMGGVDLSGMLIELYTVPLKSRRWYLRLFGYVLDLCTVNSWLLYRRETNDKKTSLKAFRGSIANALMTAGKRTAGRPSVESSPQPQKKQRVVIPIPVQDARFDNLDHWSEHGHKGRCRYCPTGFSTIRCSKCNLVLCSVANRNCFKAFHKKK